MSIATRVNKLEQEVSKHKKVILCVGIIYKDGTVDPESEQSYGQHLRTDIEGAFIWIKFMRQVIKDHVEVTK